MNDIELGKFVSYALRHGAAELKLNMDAEGWVDVDDLLRKCRENKHAMGRADLDRIVANNDKKRYVYSDDGKRIRANQGHSIKVDLKLEPKTPPPILYCGTATRFLDSINKEGIKAMSRQHVHLSASYNTAWEVGRRHGKPVVLAVDTSSALALGHNFYQAENEVWLTDYVPNTCFAIATR